MIKYTYLAIAVVFVLLLTITCTNQNSENNEMKNLYPWCIVAFDSLERSPAERMLMLKELGFDKYAYDWRDKHLDAMAGEIELARENDIEILSVWLWLNAERDSSGLLSPANERIFETMKASELRTTIWLSFSENYFEDMSQEKAMESAMEMLRFIRTKADETGSKIALYNHGGWFGDINNLVDLIEAMPGDSLSIVYNFHHGHQDIEDFPQLVEVMTPYLSAVNINGMRAEGPKILTIGEGDSEAGMMQLLIDEGYTGPWGILGHIENEDVRVVLERNIRGFNALR